MSTNVRDDERITCLHCGENNRCSQVPGTWITCRGCGRAVLSPHPVTRTPGADPKPQPCPWCGGDTSVQRHYPASKRDLSARVECDGDCFASGPSMPTPEQAVAAWNRVHLHEAGGVWLSDEEARSALSACRIAWGPASEQEDGGVFIKLRAHVEGKRDD